MRRIASHRFAEPITEALGCLPRRIRWMLEDVPILTGVDPVFAGLHTYTDTGDGRSYSSTAHVVYPFHQRHLPACARETTVVIPKLDHRYDRWGTVAMVVHELGHVLDDRLGFTEALPAVNDYAATNRYEAFAVAFQTWVWGPQPRYWDRRLDPYLALLKDGRAPALFETLAGGA